MDKTNYFKMVGGYKKFLETSGIQEDLSQLNIRQVIKRKNLAKTNLKLYTELFSNWKKRLAYTRYIRATIKACDDIQRERRKQAVAYYHSLPKEERTPKNWNKYVAEFSNSNHYLKNENIQPKIIKERTYNTHHLVPYKKVYDK